MIYFDNNATTPLAKEVKDEMIECFDVFGNPSSIHSEGQKAKFVLEKARSRVAALIGASPGEIIFTAGGTEADNLAVFGCWSGSRDFTLLTSAIEHGAILRPSEYIESAGASVKRIPAMAGGRADPSDFASELPDKGNCLVSLMLANNETGVIQPVSEVAQAARDRGFLSHTDAVQAAGKIPLDVKKLGVDMLSISSHKLHGPKGVGALYIRHGVKIVPQSRGGQQEYSIRAGTENLVSIAGFGMACELAQNSPCCENLRDLFEKEMSRIPGASVNGKDSPRVPNTSNVSFEGINNAELVINLDLCGIAASTGAACSAAQKKSSHVIMAMGLSREAASSAVRFSFSRYNTEDEILQASGIIAETVKKLRNTNV